VGLVIAIRPRSEDLHYLRPSQKRTVEHWFRPGSGQFVIDAGAHIGFHSLRAAAVGARVLAIEPNADAAEALRASLEGNRLTTVAIAELALGASRSVGRLEVPEVWDGKASLLPGWATGGRADLRVQIRGVEVAPLDELMSAELSRPVDWLLIDVEGSELDVLRGAEATLRRTQTVILEVSWATEAACRRMLEEAGLEVLAAEPQSQVTKYLVARRSVRRLAGKASDERS
jgi:FkbM family methyltransferase